MKRIENPPGCDANARFGKGACYADSVDLAAVQVPAGGVLPKPNHFATSANWLWARPFLIVLLAHTLFSLGIWNARDGYGEETSSFRRAFHSLQTGRPQSSIYVDLIVLALRWISPDPLLVATLLKYLSSLLATTALYFALNSFSSFLRPGAILSACFLWIASTLNAPYLQSTSLSLFTFAIMLFGIDCLLRRESLPGLSGFYVFGLLAASLRPEYFLAVIPMTIYVALRGLRSGSTQIESRFKISRYLTRGLVVGCGMTIGAALWVNPLAWTGERAAHLNKYVLFTFGQCYADFYQKEHPNETFTPMTEYKILFDRTFKHPDTFLGAIRNNSAEAMRYFTLNAANNLKNLPESLLHFRVRSEDSLGGLRWMLPILISGGALGVMRIRRAGWIRKDFFVRLSANLARRDSVSRKVSLLLIVAATSSAAIFLLVGSPRYFLALAPLFYLGVAFSLDSILKIPGLVRFESWLVAVSCICCCRPNYLSPRPNREMEALRHIAPNVKQCPVVAAWWAGPDAVLGLGGNAHALSSFDVIREADIEDGNIDILMIDINLRATRMWAEQRDFFEHFEHHPETCGFKKLTTLPTGRFDIYYKPKQL